MSHWNYRVLSEVVGDYTEYYVAEVYYDDEGNVKNWSKRDFNVLVWDDENNLRGTIEQLQDALAKPTLRVFGDRLVPA